MTTDFYGPTANPYRGPRLPLRDDPLERVFPAPRAAQCDRRRVLLAPRGDAPAIAFSVDSRVPGLARWLRGELETRRGIEAEESEDGASVRLSLAGTDGDPAARLLPGGPALPEHPEGYALRVSDEDAGVARLVAAARRPEGLWRAAATVVQLLEPHTDGAATSSLTISDAPGVELRILGGWALARAHGLRDAIDLAARAKANRVLYNAWGWTPAESFHEEDAYLCRYARERGIELVFELRRMSFGEGFPISDPERRRTIVEIYRRAASLGFRSFGFLFDDVAWESAGDECDFLEEVRAEIGDALGAAPELFCCPQYYWYPGQMSLSWKGAAGAAELDQQARYLETYGRLPEDVHIYLANFWGGFPRDYQDELRRRYTELIRRRPVFFDNQLINDYRLGIVLPFALAERPPDFAEHAAGYLLNAPLPLEAHAPAAAAALAYAWNPAAYIPEKALGAAILDLYGPAAEEYARALEGLLALAREWADGRYTATNHYRTIWDMLRAGRTGAAQFEAWEQALDANERAWLRCLEHASRSSGCRETSAHRGILQALASHRRLASDLGLFRAFLDARARPAGPARRRFERRAMEVTRCALETVSGFLPPLPGLAPLTDRRHGLSAREEAAPGRAPAWSWVEYFYERTRAELGAVIDAMAGDLGGFSEIG